MKHTAHIILIINNERVALFESEFEVRLNKGDILNLDDLIYIKVKRWNRKINEERNEIKEKLKKYKIKYKYNAIRLEVTEIEVFPDSLGGLALSVNAVIKK